jgi:hypothetical protein
VHSPDLAHSPAPDSSSAVESNTLFIYRSNPVSMIVLFQDFVP